jgi:hypothetical protein
MLPFHSICIWILWQAISLGKSCLVHAGWGNTDKIVVVSLPDTVVKESKDRVTSAICNAGLRWPYGPRITINLSPSDVRRKALLRSANRHGHAEKIPILSRSNRALQLSSLGFFRQVLLQRNAACWIKVRAGKGGV